MPAETALPHHPMTHAATRFRWRSRMGSPREPGPTRVLARVARLGLIVVWTGGLVCELFVCGPAFSRYLPASTIQELAILAGAPTLPVLAVAVTAVAYLVVWGTDSKRRAVLTSLDQHEACFQCGYHNCRWLPTCPECGTTPVISVQLHIHRAGRVLMPVLVLVGAVMAAATLSGEGLFATTFIAPAVLPLLLGVLTARHFRVRATPFSPPATVSPADRIDLGQIRTDPKL